MKTRSKALYTYLFNAGVLHGTPEEIDRAKREYRRAYKRIWKQAKKSKKEIRIQLTQEQFEDIKLKALQCQVTPTGFARSAILNAVAGNEPVMQRDALLQVLQLVGMAVTAIIKCTLPTSQIAEMLERAEIILLQHLEKYNT